MVEVKYVLFFHFYTMRDDFSSEEIDNTQEEILTNKDKFNNVVSYVPFLNLFLLFTQNMSTKQENKKYSRQWIALFLLYIVAFIISSIISFKLSFIVTVAYLIFALFCATKAYNGMYVEIEFLEKIIAQFQATQKTQKNNPSKESDDQPEDPLK